MATEQPSNHLKGLHLLITRPTAQAESWAKQLEALGARVTLQPMMAIEPLQGAAEKQRIIDDILNFADYQKAIFISQNAVYHGVQWLDQYWPQLPIGVDFFAIGQATADALNQYIDNGMIHMATQAMNSEALLANEHLQNIDGEKILIFRGKGGRTLLADVLQERGAQVDYCELYERVCPAKTTDAGQIVDPQFRQSEQQVIITVHSGETLDNLCSSVTQDELQWLCQQPILVPGQRVAELAKQVPFNTVITAKNATHESMIDALLQWHSQ